MGKSKRSVKKSQSESSHSLEGAGEAANEADVLPSFETALERLENSVARLEEGEMPLEEALELFEAGVKLSRQCQSTLDQAERRVEILVADREGSDDAIRSVAFEPDESGRDDLATKE